MGITHHSNYIRFMEEARLDFLRKLGYPMTRLEAEGVVSPVVSVECKYRNTSTFADVLNISVKVEKYTGVKVEFAYTGVNTESGKTIFEAKSVHCFVNSQGRPVSVKKNFPEFDAKLSAELM
ncbi:MAG: acyl-CoA thioesterase [Ruminococcus sp.]|nr:acyl-CoA thioesterase [Ruminococcus sp.]